MRTYLSFLVLLAALAAIPAHGEVRIVEHLGTEIDEALTFRNSIGDEVRLRSLTQRTPVTILTLVYYRCPAACTLLLDGLVASLKTAGFVIGKDYQLVTISVDDRETSALCAAKQTTYHNALNLSSQSERDAWPFLTGDRASIQSLTKDIGYGYRYDPDTMQYEHPSALIFLNQEGSVVRYLYGNYFQPEQFRFAFLEVANGQLGTFRENLLLKLMSYNQPETGRRYAYSTWKVTLSLLLACFPFIFLTIVFFRRSRSA